MSLCRGHGLWRKSKQVSGLEGREGLLFVAVWSGHLTEQATVGSAAGGGGQRERGVPEAAPRVSGG